jgi:hypothetical protein
MLSGVWAESGEETQRRETRKTKNPKKQKTERESFKKERPSPPFG